MNTWNNSTISAHSSLFCSIFSLTLYDTTLRSFTEKVNEQEAGTIERLDRLEGLSNIRQAEIGDLETTLNQYHKVG